MDTLIYYEITTGLLIVHYDGSDGSRRTIRYNVREAQEMVDMGQDLREWYLDEGYLEQQTT